ncbi:sensor histidine kinase [Clostridium lacusfryxellense]|uniref:sensor histidine kinase n=1 Tax=Clostridium lacusfryxellense TaxID=205328 RepID=UPI001C0E1B83|nr:sensor histidine kinase [Clostridium lacusfryxellense]MBU3113273.1 sensor histidine kinase [Clostridium lacusfryxellense]
MLLKKIFISLQYKVFIFSLFLIIIPLTTIGIISTLQNTKIIKEKIGISNSNTVSQIGNNIEMILKDAHGISLYLIQNEEVLNFFKLTDKNLDNIIDEQKVKIYNSLDHLILSKPYIESIYFKNFNGITLDTSGYINEIDKKTEEQITDLKGGYIWTFSTLIDRDNNKSNVFSLVRNVNDINRISNPVYILKININTSKLIELYKNKIIGNKGDFLIFDNNNTIISSIDKSKIGSKIQREISDLSLYKNSNGYFEIDIKGENYLVSYYSINNTDWKLVNMVPVRDLLKENIVIEKNMLLGSIIIFFLCLLFSIIFSRKIIKPIKQLMGEMDTLENDNFDVVIETKGNYEIALLSRSFNSMAIRLKELINQVYIVKLKQREAELQALQAQVNPHFLYNTLDTIYWMARVEKAYETSKLVEALSKLFRLNLNSGKDVTKVKYEIEHLKSYIVIQEKRHGDLIEFSLNIDQSLLEHNTIKLVLQPIVDNAIYHGIEKKGEHGHIDVTIKSDNNKLIFTIKDDGIGIDTIESSKFLQKVGENNRGFSIKNLNDRLKLYHGEEYGVEFINTGAGTIVNIYQPLSEGEI